MRAFYRAAVGESARPAAARPYRFLTADKLLHELREDDDEAGHGHEPSQRAQPDNPGDEDHSVRKARPDEDLCAEQGHVVGLARRHRHEHQSSEKHQILEHVAVRSRRATSPAGDLGPAVAVTGEPRQANLVERALHRHQHLHHSQRHRPYQKIQLRFHRSSFVVGLRPLWYADFRRVSRRRRALREQIADAERDVLAGERREIEIDAQHLLRPVGRLESERKSYAELGAGDRQVGPRDLGLPRSLDRAAEVVLGLPVGARGGLNGFEARVLRVRVALGVDVRADLQSVAADEIAALRAGESQQALHSRLESRAQGDVLHGILERGQVGHEPGVLALLEFGDIRAVTCDQPGERLAARVLRRQLGGGGRKIIALHQVGMGVDRAKRLGFGLDALHAYERARLVQHRDDPGEHAPRERLDRHAARHFAVDLDDVRPQPPDAVEIRVSRAEVVDHDEAAELAVVLDRGNQARFVLERRLDQLDRHPVRRKTVRLQHPQEEGAVPETLGGDLRIDVEKQPAARVAEPLEVPDMEGPALAVETYPLLALRRLAEQLQRVDAPSARGIDRANQAFVADGTAMSEAVDRLKMARQIELVAFATFSLKVVFVKKKRRSKIHHVRDAPASLRNLRYRQKYDEYAIGITSRRSDARGLRHGTPARTNPLMRHLGEKREVVAREGG